MKYYLLLFLTIFLLGISPPSTKWRIGYYEGGSYPDYQIIFIQTLKKLSERGYIKPFDIPKFDRHREMWKYIVKNIKSDYFEFVEDAFYTSDFHYPLRIINRDRINNRNDLDLIFAMGTWAGLDLQEQKYKIPTIVASTSDPLASGIIKSIEDSGYDHIHAKIEPYRYKNQLKLFHKIVNIKNLGLIYEDTLEGRTFAALDDVIDISFDNNFNIVTCVAANSGVDIAIIYKQVIRCYEQLAPNVDAFYITSHRGESLDNFPNLIEILNKYKVRSFAMNGTEFVKKGALISISTGNFSYVADFHADIVEEILINKELPRNLKQVWVAPDKVDINLKTSKIINFRFSFDILSSADNIFLE